jgi:hypothetical protein
MSTSKVDASCPKRWVIGFAVSMTLAACGGGGDSEVNGRASADSVAVSSALVKDNNFPTDSPHSLLYTSEILRKGAEMNRIELEALQSGIGEAGQGSSQPSTKAFSGLITAYRFLNRQTGAHFYTVSTAERDLIIATLPQFAYEGPAFLASAVAAQGLSQVHRFYNRLTGVHFYTISVTERNLIQQTLPQFQYEGVAYYASVAPGTGLTPLNRFFVRTRGFHFYSSSASESNGIRNNPALSHYVYEGIGYYVLGSNYEARPVVMPHTGVGTSSCYQLASNTLVACDSDAGRSLYQHQDGHRAAIRPMRYSEVPAAAAGTYARTECVRDDVTGLVWEGKNEVEPRSAAAVLPYANVAAYVSYVNSIALCGYTNWRVPDIHELQSIVHFGEWNPSQDAEWFPNAEARPYWSSTSSVVLGTPQNWVIDFYDGEPHRVSHTSSARVRLVRHQP